MLESILHINGSVNQNILQSNADFQGVHTLTVSITLKKFYCSSIYFVCGSVGNISCLNNIRLKVSRQNVMAIFPSISSPAK